MVHTAEITCRANKKLYKDFLNLQDTIHLDNKNHINSRYKDNGLIIHAQYKISSYKMKPFPFYNKK